MHSRTIVRYHFLVVLRNRCPLHPYRKRMSVSSSGDLAKNINLFTCINNQYRYSIEHFHLVAQTVVWRSTARGKARDNALVQHERAWRTHLNITMLLVWGMGCKFNVRVALVFTDSLTDH
jgi:hypothetical protein